jgi:hypothetical protein
MLKLLLFYGGMLAALLATVLIWLVWPPKLIACVSTDAANHVMRCTLKVARTFKPIRVTGLWIPSEYVQALGASPPKRFKEDPNRFVPKWPYDNATREIVAWEGRLDIARGETVELSIPIDNPLAISGTICIKYEYRGLGGVGILATSVFVPFNESTA